MDGDCIDQQERLLQEMSEKNRLLLDALGLDETKLNEALTDKSRYSDEEWVTMQRNRELLEKAVDDRIQAAKKSRKPTQVKPSEVQGHWIFVR